MSNASDPDRTPERAGPGAEWTATTFLELVLDTPSVEAYLDELATMAGGLAPAMAGVGVTVRRGPGPLTVASSNELASAVDEAQYGLGTGPCLDSLRTGERITVTDMGEVQEWGAYPGHALDHGVRSSLSVPLTVDGKTIGVLNCYGREPGMFVDDLRGRLVQFATHAELALAVALRSAQQSALVDQLHTAMQSRTVIDQALGILMARQRCTADEAFALLRSASQSRNRKLADIAADIITTTTGSRPQPGRFDV
jgi:GAF domain-containing protein